MSRSILPRIFRRTARPSSPRARTSWKVTLATVGLALGASSAGAVIVAVVPDVVQFVPTSVVLGATESDVRLIAFNERQCFALPFDLATDHGAIPKNTLMSSHFIHGDPVTNLLLSGRVRFDTDIIGVISTPAELDASDGPCGRPGVAYPLPGTEPSRGLEPAQADQYMIVAGGRGIAVTMQVPPNAASDQIRVLTCCGETCGGGGGGGGDDGVPD